MRFVDFERYFADSFTLEVHEIDPGDPDRVLSGALVESGTSGRRFEISRGVPRFVPTENYASNFGLQWNAFRTTQLDSVVGLPLSAERLWANTGWCEDEIRGKTVLEIGCGAGRFTEVLLGAGAKVVSVDFSAAVDANFANTAHLGDVAFLQGDLYELPLSPRQFDFVFCYGVLQHTPDPTRAYRCIFSNLRPGGKISVDFYRRFKLPNAWSTPKRLWRPFTKRLSPDRLLQLVRSYIPLWLPFDNAIRNIPVIGKFLIALVPIPCWNYVGLGLSDAQRRDWAILDTFDALGARYDTPLTAKQVRALVSSPQNQVTSVFHGSNGVVANVTRRSEFQHV